MPIYEFKCKDHGIFEMILPVSCSELSQIKCSNPMCNNLSDRLISIPSMQPDSFWSGKPTQQGTFNSKKAYLNYLKSKNIERVDRSIIEEVKKKSVNRLPEIAKNIEKRAEKEIAEILAPVRID